MSGEKRHTEPKAVPMNSHAVREQCDGFDAAARGGSLTTEVMLDIIAKLRNALHNEMQWHAVADQRGRLLIRIAAVGHLAEQSALSSEPTADPPDYCARCGLSTLNECSCNDPEPAAVLQVRYDTLLADWEDKVERIAELEGEQELIDCDRTRLEERIATLTRSRAREQTAHAATFAELGRLQAENERWCRVGKIADEAQLSVALSALEKAGAREKALREALEKIEQWAEQRLPLGEWRHVLNIAYDARNASRGQ